MCCAAVWSVQMSGEDRLDEPLLMAKRPSLAQASEHTELLAMSETTAGVGKVTGKPGDATKDLKMVQYSDLFRFASKRDIALIVLGTLGSLAAGAILVCTPSSLC